MAKKNNPGQSKHSKNKKRTTKKSTSINQTKQSETFPWIQAILVAIIAILLYVNTLGHGFTMDDPLVITENNIVQKGISALGEIWTSSYLEGYNGQVDAAYRPISLTQFAIGQSLFDGKASVMHFFQIFYFGLAVFLCYLFSYQLFGKKKLLALGVSLLFLSHPIHTEVVNNLKSRDELMMLIGTLGMGYFYLKHLANKQNQSLLYAMLFYFIALFCKETAVSFFLLIPVLYFWQQKNWTNKAWKDGLIFLGVSLFYLLVRTNVVGGYNIDLDYMNNALVDQGNFIARFPDAIMLLGKYLVMLIFPYPLSVDYSYNSIPMGGWNLTSVGSLLGVFALVGIFVVALKKKTFYVVPIAWFFITIVVASNIFILIGSTFAERFLFVPSLAFCLALAYFLHSAIKNKPLLLGIFIGISLVYSIWTFQRNAHWVNDLTLFQRDVQYQTNNARVLTFHGKFLYENAKKLPDAEKKKALAEAEISLAKAKELAPDYFVANYYYGFLKKNQKDYKAAAESFKAVTKFDSTFKAGRLQYAIALSYNSDYVEAVKQFEILEQQGDKSFIVQVNKGHGLLQLRRYKEAETSLLKAHNMDPQHKGTLSSLIKLYRDGMKDNATALKYNNALKALK